MQKLHLVEVENENLKSVAESIDQTVDLIDRSHTFVSLSEVTNRMCIFANNMKGLKIMTFVTVRGKPNRHIYGFLGFTKCVDQWFLIGVPQATRNARSTFRGSAKALNFAK